MAHLIPLTTLPAAAMTRLTANAPKPATRRHGATPKGLRPSLSVAGLGVAVRPAVRVPAVPAAFTASSLSLVVSAMALLGSGRTSGALSTCEALGLLGLAFLVLRRGSSRRAVTAAGSAVGAALFIIPSHATTSDSLGANAAGIVVWGLLALVVAGAARYLVALDARRARSVLEARREQRLSLAHDLHDFVAHDVSAMVVQAQAGQAVGGRDPQQALAALARIEQDGLRALAAMDRALDALRDVATSRKPSDRRSPGDPRGLHELKPLIARFETASSMRVQFEPGDAQTIELGDEAASTAHRIVTEGLTNVRRHAPGATVVRIRLASDRLGDAHALSVTVANNSGSGGNRGGSLGASGRNGGFGLRALRERVHALGGTLDAGPVDEGGWQLRARLPALGPAKAS